MILDNKPVLNSAQLKQELERLAAQNPNLYAEDGAEGTLDNQAKNVTIHDLVSQVDPNHASDHAEAGGAIRDHLTDFIDLMQVYRGAMQEISTKLEILDDEYHVRYEHNPIHHMERRLKSPQSILGKLMKRGLPLTMEALQKNIFDIAGIRVICNYIDDVYAVSRMLSQQSDIEIVEIKDYIAHPKPSGYRSLHVIYRVPVFLTTGVKTTPVEVQFRTIAMDYWASLEHKLRYKSTLSTDTISQHSDTLQDCARTLAQVEKTMQDIHRDILQATESQ